jgi:hypothetical protein
MSAAMLTPMDTGGVYPLLTLVSGYAAMERGSDLIEPRDLLKAIYIADLEHVSGFWNDWERFEAMVVAEPLIAGISISYINRPLYLLQVESIRKGARGFFGLGHPSSDFLEVVASARKFANARAGTESTPSSRDLLYGICSTNTELLEALKKSGLQLEKLATAVKGSPT